MFVTSTCYLFSYAQGRNPHPDFWGETSGGVSVDVCLWQELAIWMLAAGQVLPLGKLKNNELEYNT